MTYLAQFPKLPTPEAFFLLENYALGSKGATVFAQSNSAGNLKAENLLSPALDYSYRSGSLQERDSLVVRVSLNRGRAVDSLVVAGSNVRCPIGFALYKTNPSVSAPAYLSDWTDPIVRGRMDDWSWKEMPWTLGPDYEDLEEWTESFQLRHLMVADKTYYGIKWVDLRIRTRESDLIYQPTDYVQMSYLMCGRAFRPEVNILRGFSLGAEDLSITTRTPYGALHGSERGRLGTEAFTIPYSKRNEAYRRILTQWVKRYGKLGRIFAWLEPHQPAYFYDTSMICTAEELPEAVMANLDLLAVQGWALKETK